MGARGHGRLLERWEADGPVALQETLISSVLKRLMSDAPLGVLLSGGLDSSLVASIAVRCALPPN